MTKNVAIVSPKDQNGEIIKYLLDPKYYKGEWELLLIELDLESSLHKQLQLCKSEIENDTQILVVLNPDNNPNIRSLAANIGNRPNLQVIYCRNVNEESLAEEGRHLDHISGINKLPFYEQISPLQTRIIRLINQQTVSVAAN